MTQHNNSTAVKQWNATLCSAMYYSSPLSRSITKKLLMKIKRAYVRYVCACVCVCVCVCVCCVLWFACVCLWITWVSQMTIELVRVSYFLIVPSILSFFLSSPYLIFPFLSFPPHVGSLLFISFFFFLYSSFSSPLFIPYFLSFFIQFSPPVFLFIMFLISISTIDKFRPLSGHAMQSTIDGPSPLY